jgi:hypothetical protein
VLYWTAPPNRFFELTTRSTVTERLYPAQQEAGIGFPYPIQTILEVGAVAVDDQWRLAKAPTA